ncbi:hypothetical protein [Nitrosomonas sp. Is37]|uniref:hypothetical protein n=1 Tax=Nitrosomonas sp. Is37 TaxID=3080535 RepID=UPI00294AB668|nr:hypothetical protein [Nitrosomonas sp. Is37]MDV6345077.1 hypothetical protein [Nitrosomonas sp. Is37]
MNFLLINFYLLLSHYRCLICIASLFIIFSSSQTLAQEVIRNTEFLESNRPEAWAMNYYTTATLLSGLSVPRSRKFGSIEVGFELDWLPQLSTEERRVGLSGTKVEDLNKSPIFARPRVTIGLPWQFALTLSYVPPIKIFGLKPNLFAFALERPLYEHDSWRIGMRLYGQIGNVVGAFTCSGDDMNFEPGSPENPAGCEGKSADKAIQNYAGFELSGAYRIEKLGGLTPYIAVAGNFLDTQVNVNAPTFGVINKNRIKAETWTFSMSAGFAYPLTDKLMFSVGMFYSPLWITRPPATSSENDPFINVRSLLTYQLR